MGLGNLVKTMPKEKGTKEIMFNLNHYDDLFSDFDNKPYHQRAISDDFIQELKREFSEGHCQDVTLRMIVLEKHRNPRMEIIIKRRIEEFFKKQFNKLNKERKKQIITSISLIVIGLILLLFKYFLINLFKINTQNVFFIIIEPVSWFLFWEGSYILFFETKSNKLEFEMYKKMSKSKIIFSDNDF
jgi:hypothetical protein